MIVKPTLSTPPCSDFPFCSDEASSKLLSGGFFCPHVLQSEGLLRQYHIRLVGQRRLPGLELHLRRQHDARHRARRWQRVLQGGVGGARVRRDGVFFRREEQSRHTWEPFRGDKTMSLCLSVPCVRLSLCDTQYDPPPPAPPCPARSFFVRLPAVWPWPV